MNILEQIREYIPFNEQEERDRHEMIRWLKQGIDVFTRENQTVHMTASAWVVSPDRKYVLMAYHNLYNSWAWLGGHADGDTDLLAVAMKEAREESGIADVKVLSSKPFSLEILTVSGHEKKGKYVPSHLHLNVTYLLEADPQHQLAVKEDENSAVGWIHVDDIANKSTEAWFIDRIYNKLTNKVRTIGI